MVLIKGGFSAGQAQAAEAKTGVGLSEHVLKAYNEGWKYKYGRYGQLINGVRYTDCSGLIKSYLWWTGDHTNPNPSLSSVPGSSGAMLNAASVKGDIKTLPRIHGLILYSPGHVGVYIGNNMEIDNREEGEDILCRPVAGGRYHWAKWFKLPQIHYPTSGFVTYNGNQYYYENGQYVEQTQKTVNGVVYKFNKGGTLLSGDMNSVTKAVNVALDNGSCILQYGQEGSDVLALQKRLSELGYIRSCDCTGYYDSATKTAVLAYQNAAGLSGTGIADSAVLQSVNSSAAVSAN